jgi:hypothetical protein
VAWFLFGAGIRVRGGADYGDEQRNNGYDGKCPLRFRCHEHFYNSQPFSDHGFGQ